ncbi:MAG: IS110 family transposase, partial [Clostridia bacterium]
MLIADLKRKVICVLDQVFPEYESLFRDIFGATSKEVLLSYSSPAELESLSVQTFTTFLETARRKKRGETKAEQILDAAKHSFGVAHCRDSFSFQLHLRYEMIHMASDACPTAKIC